MSVNIKWLAKELNLSIATVSPALQDNYMVSEETKQRVLELAKKANYRANPYASSLRLLVKQIIINANDFPLFISKSDSILDKTNI